MTSQTKYTKAATSAPAEDFPLHTDYYVSPSLSALSYTTDSSANYSPPTAARSRSPGFALTLTSPAHLAVAAAALASPPPAAALLPAIASPASSSSALPRSPLHLPTAAMLAPPASDAAAPASRPLQDELSAPFYKALGVVFVEVDEPHSECDLCNYASVRAPPPPLPPTASTSTDSNRNSSSSSNSSCHSHDDDRWGVLWDVVEDVCLCSEEKEEDQHAFHVRCLRSFIHYNKPVYRVEPACPICEAMIGSGDRDVHKAATDAAAAGSGAKHTVVEVKSARGSRMVLAKAPPAAAEEDDTLAFAAEEVGQTGGKKRKREAQAYTCYIHIIQATGLQLGTSSTAITPVASLSCFTQSAQTARGVSNKKTYGCVWDQTFTFTKSMDVDELSRSTITVRIEDYHALRSNTSVGFIKFEAAYVNRMPNHELYQQWTPIVSVASAKGKSSAHNMGMQGKLQVSVCVLSAADCVANPRLPIHTYDLEVQMWADMSQKQAVLDFDVSATYLSEKITQKQQHDATLTSSLWDLLHIFVYEARDLPKMNKLRGWCDSYVEVDYKGLSQSSDSSNGSKKGTLRSAVHKNAASPRYNTCFTLPLMRLSSRISTSMSLYHPMPLHSRRCSGSDATQANSCLAASYTRSCTAE